VEDLLKAGYTYVVDADLKSYFDTIPHEPLEKLIRAKVGDRRILRLLKDLLNQSILDELNRWQPDAGSPQGAVISPLLSNIYLDRLDHQMAAKGYEMIRYADDFVVLCRSPEEAERALAAVRHWTEEAGLRLHPDKTGIADAQSREGFQFLGYRFTAGRRYPRQQSIQKLKDTIRSHTRRTNGHSLESIIHRINPTLRGWFGYFKHATKTSFPRLDSWIRMRLRSILRVRHRGRGRGRGRGLDHYRWPNAFFADLGLYSLVEAHAEACQSEPGHSPTGEPYAGEPHVRFGGGRDRANRSFLPLL